MRKLLVLTIFVLFLVGSSLSINVIINDVDYRGEIGSSPAIIDQADDEDVQEVGICGDTWDVQTVSGSDSIYEFDAGVFDSTYDVPEEMACGQGLKDVTVYYDGGNENFQDQFSVNAVNMNAHYGEHLVQGINIGDNNVGDFFLTDDSNTLGSQIPPNNIQLTNYNNFGNDEAWAEPELGVPVSNDDTLSKMISECPTSGGDEDGCDVADQEYRFDYNLNFGNSVYLNDVNSVSPVHEDAGDPSGGTTDTFRIDGELIFADGAEYYGESGDEQTSVGENFFICREGATMTNGWGETIPRVVEDGDGQHFICNIEVDGMDSVPKPDYNSESWVRVDDLETGLSHEADANCIDNPDSWYHENLNGDGEACGEATACQVGAVIAEVNNPDGVSPTENGNTAGTASTDTFQDLVAQYPTGEDSCNTDTPIQFDSLDRHTNWVNSISGYPRVRECQEVFDSGLCPINPNYGTDEPIAEYVPEREYFTEQLFSINDGAVDTEFTNSNGWTVGRQSLGEAENFYRPDGPRSFDEWEGDILEDQVYDDSSTSNHIDAWFVANAGLNEEGEVVSTPSAEEETVFDGGFAAECPAGQRWGYEIDEDQWQCIGEQASCTMDNVDQTVEMPQISLETGESRFLGFKLHPTVAMDFTELSEYTDWSDDNTPTSFRNAQSSSCGQLETVNVECWAGQVNAREKDGAGGVDDDQIISGSAPVKSDEITGIYGEVSDWSYQFGRAYHCEWSYETTEGVVVDSPSKGVTDRLGIEVHNDAGNFDVPTDIRRMADDHRDAAGTSQFSYSLSEFEDEWGDKLNKVENKASQ